MSVEMSSNFKTQARVVKSFSKTLDPGDTLDFRMIHHCGPGIRFDIAQSYLTAFQSKGTQPSSYGIIVEAVGTACEGVRFSDNAVFQSTSPGFYNYEYKKIIVAVKHSSLLGDVESIGNATINKKYAIKVYEKNQMSVRPFNVDVSQIGNRDEKGKTFGVMSTSSERPVYSQNIISEKKEKEENSDIKEINKDIEEEDLW
jgi:hypothetical protein